MLAPFSGHHLDHSTMKINSYHVKHAHDHDEKAYPKSLLPHTRHALRLPGCY